MNDHPVNLAFRFILEVYGLVIMGMWGWHFQDSWLKWLLVISLPLLASILWVTFNVPHDPSRSGQAPVPVPGIIRLFLELLIFGFATWAYYDLGYVTPSIIMGIILFIHYLVSYDRILWLISQK